MSGIKIELGKIENAWFGINDGMIGLHVTLSGEGWATCYETSAWDFMQVEYSEYCNWTEEDRAHLYADIIRHISKFLADAKVQSVNDLKGKPVKVSFKDNRLTDWRILTEVL